MSGRYASGGAVIFACRGLVNARDRAVGLNRLQGSVVVARLSFPWHDPDPSEYM